jgi:hypothetical protein
LVSNSSEQPALPGIVTGVGDVTNAAAAMHTPAVQVEPPGHTVPHRPQLFESVRKSTQLAPHSVRPGGHVPPHTDAVHVAVPPEGVAHARPQPPQWRGSLAVAVSHPFAAMPSQSACPGAHARAHIPAAQLAICPGPAEQRVPHEPQ